MKKKIIIPLLFSLVFSSICGCGKEEQKSVSKSGFYFDTIVTITLYDSDNEKLIYDCFSKAEEYENLLSNTIEGSDIYNINNHPGEYVEVSDITIDLLEQSIYYSKLSDGAFDVTIGSLSDLWNISELAQNTNDENHVYDQEILPKEEIINELICHVNYNNINISDNKVMLMDAQCKIDLGGIAKGYIANQMKAYLNDNGITSGIINLGGNILTLGEKSTDESYLLGIQYPFENLGTAIASLKVKDAAVVSSGVYERYIRVNDKIYHHILDTDTGYPVESDLLEVTIVTSDSCKGDALSTICLSYGKDKSMDFIESLDDVEAIFITDDYQVSYTSGLEGYVEIEE